MRTTTLILIFCSSGLAQINLGSFSLHPSNAGGFDLGLGQSANIFGFGGDRGLKLNGGPGGIGLQGSQGALIGNERVGVDTGLGIQQGRGVDLGSNLQFGNNPQPMHPGGQLGSFLDNIKNFFASMVPPPASSVMPLPMASTLPPTLRPHIGTEGSSRMGMQRPGETGEFPSEVNAWETDEESVLPIDGDTDKKTDTVDRVEETEVEPDNNNKEDNKEDNMEGLFQRATEKPRQLPGLVEFLRRL